jgi:hypothetical protein
MITTAPTKRPKLNRRMARAPQADQQPNPAQSTSPTTPAKRPTKALQVTQMLTRGEGASLDELCQVTSWQPHTARAFLTGLRKKGSVIERSKREDGTTFYRLPAGTSLEVQESVEANA